MFLFITKLESTSKVNKIQKSTNSKIQKISDHEIKKYIMERFEDVKRAHKIKDLVTFQAKNKYMFMVHSQEELKKLGNLVASNKKISLSNILREYEKHLNLALEKKPTIKTHINVLMHMFGYFAKDFNQIQKDQFLEVVEQFRERKVSIGNVLSQINPLVFQFNNTYLASQTYFLLYADPNPRNVFHFLQNTDKTDGK